MQSPSSSSYESAAPFPSASSSQPRRQRTDRSAKMTPTVMLPSWPRRALAALVIVTIMGLSSIAPAQAAGAGIGGVKELYTSSVAYCSPPEALIVENADLSIYPDDSTLEFLLEAASLDSNIDATVDVTVNAYGMSLLDISLDLCTIAGGLLCPLPQYEFDGGGTYPLPDEILSEVPSLAWYVPDLEAVATLQLTNATGNIVSCVQVTLSNGHTAEQSGAKWATVGLALLALFSSILHTCIAQSTGAAQWRIVDVMMTIQHIATTGLLSLDYPSVFVYYAVNFAWSLGLVNIDSLQNSITATRSATGGHTAAVFGAVLTATTARANNKIAEDSSSSTSSIGSLLGSLTRRTEGPRVLLRAIAEPIRARASQFVKRAAQYAPNTGADGLTITSSASYNLPVITDSDTADLGGVSVYTQRAYVAPDNAFLTVLVSIFILIAIVVGALLLTYAIAALIKLFTRKRESRVSHWSRRITRPTEFGYVVSATFSRLFLVTFPIYLIFAFYQWRSGDSWVPDFLAAIFLVFFLVAGAVFYIPLFRQARRGSSADLYYGEKEAPVRGSAHVKRWGHLAHPFRPRFWFFSLIFVLMGFVRACFISFAQGEDFVQAVGLLVFEFVFFLIFCICRVGRDKKSDAVYIILAAFRVASYAVCVALTQRANVQKIPRAVVAFILIAITALPILFVAYVTFLDLVSALRSSKLRPDHKDGTADQALMAEKNGYVTSTSKGDPSSYGYGTVGGGAALGTAAATHGGDSEKTSSTPDDYLKARDPKVAASTRDAGFVTPPTDTVPTSGSATPDDAPTVVDHSPMNATETHHGEHVASSTEGSTFPAGFDRVQ